MLFSSFLSQNTFFSCNMSIFAKPWVCQNLCFCQGCNGDCTKQLLLLVCRLKSSVSFLTRPDRPNIAYQKLKGRNPGVIFLPGFNSNMNGQKATALEDFCKSLGHAYIRYIEECCSWENGTSLMGCRKGF